MPRARLQDCSDDAAALVRRWLEASADVKPDPGAARLAEVLRDEQGLDFTLGFIDRVVRPEDPRVAARHLEQLSQGVPDAPFCPHCGVAQPLISSCRGCGERVVVPLHLLAQAPVSQSPLAALHCPRCGTELPGEMATTASQSSDAA